MFNALFQQPWWLDAVAPGQWGEACVKRGQEVAARLPYVRVRRFGSTLLVMPPLTQALGPWLRPSEAKYAKQMAEQKDLMTALVEQLPPYQYFSQNFHHSVTNWLPFYWKGFRQTTRYTYILEDLTDPEKLWAGFMENIRTDIRKAQRRLEVRDDLGLDRFIEINALTFQRQGINLPYSKGLIRRIDASCVKRGVRRTFFAEDAEGRLHAALYIVWDKNAAYYLMSGSNPELRNSGAGSLLVWEALKFAASVTRTFDFEGSMIESVERFFRAFGAKQVPFFRVTHVKLPFRRVHNDIRTWGNRFLRKKPGTEKPGFREAEGCKR